LIYNYMKIERIEENRICPNCGTSFIVKGTMSEFNRGVVKKFCTRKCSNKRSFSDETKSKISKSLKISPFRYQPHSKGEIKLIEFTCQFCGELGFDSRYKKNRKYHLECSKKCSGGIRKGSSRGKSGWYKGFWCDSSYELSYLIYSLENGIKIERNKEGFEYVHKNENHLFYPDFIVEGKYVEIKNFRSELTDDKLKYFPHEISIYYSDTIQPYLKYVRGKYGKKFTCLYEGS